MAERKRIGLIFSYNENWIAGAYYILNIVHALKVIDDSEKPIVVILSESFENFENLQNETAYPFLEYVQYPFPKVRYSFTERAINKMSRLVLKKNKIIKVNEKPLLDAVYPTQLKGLSDNLKKVNWIPDFQEDYFPQFFSEEEVLKRKKIQKQKYAQGDIVVLSSVDAESDFKRLYPEARAKTFVLPFAVTHPDYSQESIQDLLETYKLPKHYFFAPNQFWAHKNHMVILQAVKILKDKGIKVTVAMSGKENDCRNKDNFDTLKNYIKENKLATQIIFLGFLPRTEQLCLFKNAQAIIQSSLFEGWSTVIEDAKALGKFVIVSNLRVHREQLKDNAWFFNPNNATELVNLMENYLHESPKFKKLDYNKSIFEFGKNFNDLIKLATS